MKLLCVADTVTKSLFTKSKRDVLFQDIDCIIGCGDLPPEYLSKLKYHFDIPLFYVLGNHDIRYTTTPPSGCTNIDQKIIRIGGKTVTGFSGSRWYNGGENQYSEKQMTRRIKGMRFSFWRNRGVDIIITHAPPRFIHDAEDRCHRGFRIFHWLIDKYQPKLFVHGHIHAHFEDDSERITTIGSTRVINSYGYQILEL